MSDFCNTTCYDRKWKFSHVTVRDKRWTWCRCFVGVVRWVANFNTHTFITTTFSLKNVNAKFKPIFLFQETRLCGDKWNSHYKSTFINGQNIGQNTRRYVATRQSVNAVGASHGNGQHGSGTTHNDSKRITCFYFSSCVKNFLSIDDVVVVIERE